MLLINSVLSLPCVALLSIFPSIWVVNMLQRVVNDIPCVLSSGDVIINHQFFQTLVRILTFDFLLLQQHILRIRYQHISDILDFFFCYQSLGSWFKPGVTSGVIMKTVPLKFWGWSLTKNFGNLTVYLFV